MDFYLIHWDSDIPESEVILEYYDHFDARGMRRVYGRGDHFARYSTYNLDIWRNRQGRLFMRCWSRNKEVDWLSYEIIGYDVDLIPEYDRNCAFEDDWIPKAVRQEYESWILSE